MRQRVIVSTRALAIALLSMLLLVATMPGVRAQSYPNHAVRIIVPTSAGGSIDALARLMAAQLSAMWKEPVVVENRPGAAMRVGVEEVARSAPDGYTLLVAHDGAMAMNPSLYSDLQYDPQKDFAPIALLVSIPEVILVNANTHFSTLAEMLDFARKNPGKLNHATGGPASLLDLELLKSMAKVDITSVQYRGAAPSVTATMAGEVQLCITDLAAATPGLASGRVRPLAVTTLERVKSYRNVPTANEAGVPGYNVQVWMGMFAPSGTPNAVLRKIQMTIQEILSQADVQQKLASMAMVKRSGTAADLRAALSTDIPRWAKLVKEKNLRITQ
jgi:tripartite-type tricarboxylate transporter receptor subunit TctC